MKRTLAVLLSLLMLFGCLPVTGFSVSDGAADGNAAAFMRIVHLDCGRKYFSAEEIKGVIDMAAENLYTHVELAFGNEGLRFLLDDMSVSVNGASYESDAVTAAVQTGNQNYTAYSSGELTESEMDEILAYAAEQGISIIPLLNSPGHMNALMTAGEALTKQTLSYSGSERTIDVTNTTATAFTLAVLEKYVRYFADKGCTHFNLGADEYANDISSSGFGAIQSAGLYDDYIAYVNSAAAIVKEAGMTPMAFNDGIYFNNVTSSGTFDSDIAVCFWTSGWTGYTVASASTLAQKGHEIINTNDNWYYVLGNTTGYYNLSRAQTGTKETACTTVLTDSSGSVTPIGCMLCIWCDSPSVSYTTAEQENISGLLSNLAENNADYFKAPENSGDNETVTPAPAAYDVDALKYENGSYWFRVAGTDEWNQLNWTLHDDNNTRNTGHQLVFYYACRYINDEKAGIYTSDWGEPDYSGVVHITFELYLVEGENYAQAELLESEWDGFANGIQVITTLYDPSYEVARSEVDYSDTPGVDKIYNGQITDVPAVEAKRECTVRIYIRLKETFSVQYDWLNEPSGYNPPNGETGIESGSSYTVDTTYTSDTTVQAGVYTYTFSGWYLDSEYTQPASATLTINSDVTLYGKWTRKLDNTIIITAASNKKVYDGSELTDDSFIVTYQGKDIPRNDNGTYTINNVEVTIDATVSGSQTSVGSSTNSITVISITDNAGTVYSHTTVNGTLTVYPKIVVEYYKDSIDASNKLNMDEIGYQTNLSPEHGGALLSVGGHVTLSDEWLNEYKPNGYQDGVQQEPVPYVIGSDENKVVIRVLYQPAYTSLTIHKKGAVDLDEHQTFLFRVVGEGDDVDVTVTVHGNSSVTIDGLTVGKQYTVTEITDWSWRYGSTTVTTTLPESNWSAPAGGSGINVTLASGAAQNIVTFQNERTVPYWLDGDNFCVNVFASSTQN